ncbi:MAG: hypothetical protein V4582_09020 [Pseudomonadota bacterium]
MSIFYMKSALVAYAARQTRLFKLAEGRVPFAEGVAVLLEFVVTGTGYERYTNVEDVSGAAD